MNEYAEIIARRLRKNKQQLKKDFSGHVRCCHIDDLLPPEIVNNAFENAPGLNDMMRIENKKERKYVSTNLRQLASPIAELVKAFAQQSVADVIAEVMGKERLETDVYLYNGGITSMMPDDFMHPHLDNSHDYDRARRREVVLLYYLTPDWKKDDGGYLEVWMHDFIPHRIDYKQNRLVIMETTNNSWHSIRPVSGPQPRISLTTYFYSPASVKHPLRLTRFTGWPGEYIKSAIFSTEFHVRNIAARVISRKLISNRHKAVM